MRGLNGASLDLRVKCPYCDYASTVIARDIRGQKFVLSCLDCKETYVVEVAVQAAHVVRALADVDVDAVLKKLRAKKGNSEPKPPARPALKVPKPELKARRIEGTRY